MGEICEVIGGGTPKTDVPEYWGEEIPWLTPRDLSNFLGRYISKGERNISNLGLSESSAKLLPKGAVLLTTRAPIGYLAIAENEISTNQGFRSLVPNKGTDNLFLFYLLKQKVEYLKSQSSGTTFGELAGSTLKSLSFLFPTLPEQKAIAEVLSSLDDKIDLLHRQNKTLEDMAQALFRKWFVEDADEGWEVGKLGDVISISSGKGIKRDEYIPNGEIPILGANGEIGRTNKHLFNEKIIFTGRVGSLGSVFISDGKAWLSDNTLIIRPKLEYFYITYFLLKNAKLENRNVGSTQPLIRQSDVKELDFSFPKNRNLQKFELQADLFFQKTSKNKSQIRILEKLRDILLPKLMSGEVRAKI